MIADTWEPFFRAGYSENGGALWEGSVSAGFGYHPANKSGVLGVGLNWSRPAADVFGAGMDDQYTTEIYYRFQVMKVLSVTPDVQLIIDPALDPEEGSVWVFGLRARLVF